MQRIKSPIIPLKMADIDTDVIIPAKHLTTTEKTGLGAHLFAQVREMDPQFPFNLEKYRSAQILVVGRNFGCGSSREHAVWALADWGIHAVLAPSFADIFYNNALKNFLLPVVISEEIYHKIMAEEEGSGAYEIEVDVEKQVVKLPDGTEVPFELDPYRRECLLKEMDDLDYLLSQMPAIRRFKERQHLFFDIQSIPNS